MNNILKFDDFISEKILNDVRINISELLDILGDNKKDLHTTLEIDPDIIKIKDNIDKLYDSDLLQKSLEDKKLKKSQLFDTKYFETLLKNNCELKFFMIYDIDQSELEEPKYIILQYILNDKKSEIFLYKNDQSINKFYEKLTDSVIELQKGKKTYLYKTDNSGNNWDMRNQKMSKGKFKKELDIDEIEELVKKDKNIQVQ